MDRNFAEAMRYLSSPAGSFWKWDDQGAVVVWANGSTLAFREELTIMLERLAPEGLPALDAVLLLVGATRAYWAEDSLPLQHRVRARDEIGPNEGAARTIGSMLFSRLETIHELPDELIRTTESKAELAAIVFESAPRVVSTEVAAVVCEILAKRLNDALPNLSKLRGGRVQTAKSLAHDLWPLCHGLEGVTKESFELRHKTGLDAVPEPLPHEYPVEQPVMCRVLQELASDEEFAGLSRLARNLSAVVQLPRAMTDSHELPLGGVSDLTNRGTLDRLLLSELAHDDLMLATRVALNEALYLRREIPPSFPPERRHVLVDAGLRMWGVPRIFATAVVLSLATTGEKDSTLSAYRAAGTNVVPIDLTNRGGLIEHLGTLETDVHPGEALAEFMRRVEQSEQPSDIVIVTTEAALIDPEFRRNLAEFSPQRWYVATVNRDGAFQLWSHGPRGKKCYSSLRLELDAILSSPQSAKKSLIDPSSDPRQPAILGATSFPFRLPYQFEREFKNETIWSVPLKRYREQVRRKLDSNASANIMIVSGASPPVTPDDYGVMVLTRERTLLFFDDPQRGARLIGEGLPFGICLRSWSSADDLTLFVVIFRPSESALYLLTIPLNHSKVRSDRLPSKFLGIPGSASALRGVTKHGSCIFVIFNRLIETFSVETGEFLDSTSSDLTAQWERGRYLRNRAIGHTAPWYALSFDGVSIQTQQVPLGKYAYPILLREMFDRRGNDGPFATRIGSEGRLINLSEQTEIQFSDGLHRDVLIVDWDEDGRRILYESNSGGKNANFVAKLDDVPTRPVVVGSTVKTLAAYDASCLRTAHPNMRRFLRVFLGDEQLTLVSKGQAYWQFAVGKGVIKMLQSGHPKIARLTRGFELVKHPTSGFTLQMAEWADGSRIWIDSRGLLHLQSSDPLIAEATLVLNPNNVSVWTSDGRMLGPDYYVDRSKSLLLPEEVIEMILIPFVSRLR